MNITISQIKELRSTTGAGVLEAKDALVSANGDFVEALKIISNKGNRKAEKLQYRSLNAGLVAGVKSGDKATLLRISSETDFVAKNKTVVDLVDTLCHLFNDSDRLNLEKATSLKLPTGETVEEKLQQLSAKMGERIELTQVASLTGNTALYLHKRSSDLPPQMGLIVSWEGGNEEVGKSLSLEIAGLNPLYLSRENVPKEVIENIRSKAVASATAAGKPQNLIEKIAAGAVEKYCKTSVLLEQDVLRGPKATVAHWLSSENVSNVRYARFEVPLPERNVSESSFCRR